jgi:hypothetical protein
MATIGAKIINSRLIESALVKAFEEWADQDVNDKFFSEQFIAREWPYPGPETIRKSRGPAGDPRDIYDTGALFKSGQESFTLQASTNGASANWHWDAKNSSGQEYAFYVHEGKGPYSRVPRKWTDDLVIPSLFEMSEARADLGARITIEFARMYGR